MARMAKNQMLLQSFLPIAFLWSSLAAEAPKATGTITGVVRFAGKVPPSKKITATDGTTIEHNDLVVDAKTKGLRFVVASLEDAPAQPKVEKAEPIVVDQRDMVFLPRTVAVQHGRAVRFDNNDTCNHSVMASSPLAANQFNVFVLQGKPYDHIFEVQKHPVQIGCSLHGWMRAWVYVVPHPWFAVSDTEGRFTIKDVPPGKYKLWLRHADTGLQERREVEVKAGQTAEVSIEWKEVRR
jgi:plastocyanin